jgi:hypothetical protein
MSKDIREMIDRVKNFKQFNESKNSKYLTLYHGSNEYFDNFKLSKKEDGFNAFGDGIYFVDNKNEANVYGDYIYKCEVIINKVFDVDKNIEEYNRIKEIDFNTTPILIRNGYDSLKINKNYFNIFIVFDVNNIKITSVDKFY